MKAGVQRRRWILTIAAIAIASAASAADPNKILGVAANDIDTLDPHQYNDNPSFEVLISIFEPLYEWDYLESPPKLSPLTATAPIEISDGGRRWTMRVKPGIFFTDDPAFKGKPRTTVPPSNFCAAGPLPSRSLPRARSPSSRERTCPCCRQYSVSRTTSFSRGCAASARRYSRPTGSISTSTSIGASRSGGDAGRQVQEPAKARPAVPHGIGGEGIARETLQKSRQRAAPMPMVMRESGGSLKPPTSTSAVVMRLPSWTELS